ncbi:hypothetical protein RFI_04052 [Reticulomyxa filosa]|uniref:Uncharacterized protein n=1 Tax=Reticulomyxa filosa TaxID=46433 RepID=X6P4P9_RETFI|nr:hypothetical protein RFI_04052 [Reticulomyxa filosa]|eukprot:ETO33054.1 hypothetical protein RFI_04052 [Reticulomyxa filosa]
MYIIVIHPDIYLKKIAIKLNETQIDSVFTCLINGIKGNDEKNRKLYAESIEFLLMKLNKKQLDDVFECLNDRQLNRVFSTFIDRLKNTNKWDRESCAKSLEVISKKLDGSN